MPACCICYTTDPGYLLPTFVSAIQARRHAAADKADVAIFSFGADQQTEQAFAIACAAEQIRFFPVPVSSIDGADVMLARLFLSRIVPDEYTQFLYIDGDTQVTGALDQLLDYKVPDGMFLACNDPMTFEISGGDGRQNKNISSYFSSVGIPRERAVNYFNTGVLRINRTGWDEIGLSAWELFVKNQYNSRYPDQDVLNIVGQDRRISMSLAWNFPIFMRNSRVEHKIHPRIYHFMGSPKPWHGVFLPWGESTHRPYIDAIRKYPALTAYLSVMPAPKRFRYFLQQHYKKATETFDWGMGDKRARILKYETELGMVLDQPILQ